jgi:hypothetical protein
LRTRLSIILERAEEDFPSFLTLVFESYIFVPYVILNLFLTFGKTGMKTLRGITSV